MMKKLFLIFLPIAVAAAVSCGRETVESKGDSGIGFYTFTTRSAGIDNAANVAARGGFQVWGYVHQGNWPAAPVRTMFDGTNVTSDDGGTTWSYSGVWAVWPERHNVSFFAFAPAYANGAVIDASGEVPVIEFTVDDAPASQQDLLIAQQMLDRTGPNPVVVALEHSLSRISFSARKTPETVADINVTGIELRDISYRGLTQMTVPASWTIYPDVTQYTLTVADGLLADTSPSITDVSQPISTPAGTMFLMPHTLAPTAVAVITYSYTEAPMPSEELTFEITLSDVTAEWQPGTTYNYQILFEKPADSGFAPRNVRGTNFGQGAILPPSITLSVR